MQKEFLFDKNLSSGNISNGNAPNVLFNFTPYPVVQRSQLNYMSGTLTSLIGVVGFRPDGSHGYSDNLLLRDEIFSLSTTEKSLFLKNRKGDVFPIRLTGSTQMETMDNTREQAQNATISWTQIGSMDGISIIAIPSNESP